MNGKQVKLARKLAFADAYDLKAYSDVEYETRKQIVNARNKPSWTPRVMSIMCLRFHYQLAKKRLKANDPAIIHRLLERAIEGWADGTINPL